MEEKKAEGSEHKSQSIHNGAEDSREFPSQPEGKDISEVENPDLGEDEEIDIEAQGLATSDRPLVYFV